MHAYILYITFTQSYVILHYITQHTHVYLTSSFLLLFVAGWLFLAHRVRYSKGPLSEPAPPWSCSIIVSRSSEGIETTLGRGTSPHSGHAAAESGSQQSEHPASKIIVLTILSILILIVHILYIFLCSVHIFFSPENKSLECPTACSNPLSMPIKPHPASWALPWKDGLFRLHIL